jgi:hypothetical protein
MSFHGSPGGRVPIASRSAFAPPALDEPFCLRCSKRIAIRLEGNIDLRCGWNGGEKKCDYCAGPTIKKKCNNVSSL